MRVNRLARPTSADHTLYRRGCADRHLKSFDMDEKELPVKNTPRDSWPPGTCASPTAGGRDRARGLFRMPASRNPNEAVALRSSSA
jgi:hypothetical protein